MKLQAKKDRILGRRSRVGEQISRNAAENRLYDACCTALESARALEREAGASQRGTTMPSIVCFSSTLEALANASLMMHQDALEDPAADSNSRDNRATGRLLEATLNLRLAAKACALEAEGPKSTS